MIDILKGLSFIRENKETQMIEREEQEQIALNECKRLQVDVNSIKNWSSLNEAMEQCTKVALLIRELYEYYQPDPQLGPGGLNFAEQPLEVQLHDERVRFVDKQHQVDELEELLERATDHISTHQGDTYTLGKDVAEYRRKYS